MPSGSLPTYGYAPAPSKRAPLLETHSSRRARLFAGGTYFRARDPGQEGNRITIGVLLDGADGFCVITNHNLKFDENVSGPVDVRLLNLNASYADFWQVHDLTTTPKCAQYSISLRIRNSMTLGLPYVLPPPIGSADFRDSSLFTGFPNIAVQTQKRAPFFAPGDVISITPRVKCYALLRLEIPSSTDASGATSGPFSGFDIADLRAKVNADCPWVEMLERSGATSVGGVSTPNPNPADVQDTGVDAEVLTPFAETALTGGDGLPAAPSGISTGPTRSLVHVNYGERQNGFLGEHNVVYEWVGDSSTAGIWKPY